MDNQTSLLVTSVIVNLLLILDKCLRRVTKSECCGSKLVLDSSSPTNQVNHELNLSNIKVIDESLSNIKN